MASHLNFLHLLTPISDGGGEKPHNVSHEQLRLRAAASLASCAPADHVGLALRSFLLQQQSTLISSSLIQGMRAELELGSAVVGGAMVLPSQAALSTLPSLQPFAHLLQGKRAHPSATSEQSRLQDGAPTRPNPREDDGNLGGEARRETMGMSGSAGAPSMAAGAPPHSIGHGIASSGDHGAGSESFGIRKRPRVDLDENAGTQWFNQHALSSPLRSTWEGSGGPLAVAAASAAVVAGALVAAGRMAVCVGLAAVAAPAAATAGGVVGGREAAAVVATAMAATALLKAVVLRRTRLTVEALVGLLAASVREGSSQPNPRWSRTSARRVAGKVAAADMAVATVAAKATAAPAKATMATVVLTVGIMVVVMVVEVMVVGDTVAAVAAGREALRD